MKLKRLALLSVFQLSAHATAVANLKDTPLTFTVSGKDSDASRLYDSLAVKPDAAKTKKLISVDQNFSIECVKLKKEATCTIRLFPSNDTEIHPEKDYAYLSLMDDDGSDNRPGNIFGQLVKNKQGHFPMYFSEKQDLAFSSSAKRFVFTYRKAESKWRLSWPFSARD